MSRSPALLRLVRGAAVRHASAARAASGGSPAYPTGRLIVFDTTLRDGEQSPGCTLQRAEKLAVRAWSDLGAVAPVCATPPTTPTPFPPQNHHANPHFPPQIAHALNALGVDVCEAGFPVASQGDFDAVQAIAREVGHAPGPSSRPQPMVICGLARALEKDIDRAYEAVRLAPRHRIHTFLATSDIHVRAARGGCGSCRGGRSRAHAAAVPSPAQLKHKLRCSRSEAVECAVRAVRHARSLCADVEFSTEDGGRSDRAFLVDAIGAVIEAGASTINVPDTVGYTLPGEYGGLFAHLIANVRGAERVVWSTHCHNDLGLATANTLAAVQAGARQVEVTINGLGERAGNTALEEVVMTLATRPHLFAARAAGIDTTQIMRTSKLVSHLTGMAVQANKAVVGANAFAHESGIHQDGMLKEASTYEIMTPASIGLTKTALVLGKHSGRAAYAARMRELGLAVAGPALEALVDKLKALADEKKVITDADIEALAYAGLAAADAPTTWVLDCAHVFTGTEAKPTATVTLRHSRTGDERSAAALGCGPIDAVYNAIRAVVGRPNDLIDFAIKSATDGTNALGEVTIKISSAADGTGKRQVAHLPRVAAAADADAEAAAKLSRFNAPEENTGRAVYSGTATDKDIIVASARAYVAALNRLLAADESKGAVLGAGAIGAGV